MKAIFMGRKPYSCRALEFLLESGVEVVCVVAPEDSVSVHWSPRLSTFAKEKGLLLVSDDDIYAHISGEKDIGLDLSSIDVVISYLFWKKIKPPLIRLPGYGCINFHPAPLPDFRGVGGYNVAIYEGLSEWGVSAHFVDEDFDTGDIISVEKFPIDPERETAFSLEQKSQRHLLDLFKSVMKDIVSGEDLPRIKQTKGRYITRSEFEALRKVLPDDPHEIIDRKIRAFWYPPYGGAYVEIGGREFTLANDFVLKEAGQYYHRRTGGNQ